MDSQSKNNEYTNKSTNEQEKKRELRIEEIKRRGKQQSVGKEELERDLKQAIQE
jgi:hypothetical protein